MLLPGMGYQDLLSMTGPIFWQWHEITLEKYREIKGATG